MSNILSFVGTIGRDAEARYTQSGSVVLTVSVACTSGFGKNKKTAWIRVSVFGKRAEGGLGDHLKKGQQVFVSGELSVNEYQAKDGTTKTSLELVATALDLVGGRKEAAPSTEKPDKGALSTSAADHDNFDDSLDIPF